MNVRRTLLALVLAGIATGPARAAEPQPAAAAAGKPTAEPVDAELLEFLGSLDTEEEGWREFLEDRPLRPAAERPATGKPVREPETKPAKVDKQ
jgi:hypothetical protein